MLLSSENPSLKDELENLKHDNDFATLMIIHHPSAIDNASAYLHYGNNKQIRDMAHNIVDSQTMEIIELSNWVIANKR